MQNESERTVPAKSPFLMRFAERRVGSDVLPGQYCHEREVWVVDTPNGSIPIILSEERCLAAETATKVVSEQTDQPSLTAHSGTVATYTSTAVEMEQTDIRSDAMALRLVATLTEVHTEQTDK